MVTDPTSRTLLAIVAAVLLLWFVYLVREVLPPFLIALAIAAAFDPLLDRVQKIPHMSRAGAVAIVYVLFFGSIAVVLVYLIPLAIEQAQRLADLTPKASEYLTEARLWFDQFLRRNTTLLERFHLPHTTTELLNQYQGQLVRYAQVALGGLFGTFQASASKIIWVVIIPIASLYLMMDYDRVRGRFLFCMPEHQRESFVHLAGRISAVFMGYLRGLAVVCVGFAVVAYILLAFLFRLDYALLLALVGGVLYAIPYIGAISFLLVCGIVSASTGHPWGFTIGLVVSLLVANQVFDYGIFPRVVGSSVGLHPVISIFALAVGGSLFGLVGMILSMPVAASIQEVMVHYYPRLAEPVPGARERPKPRRRRR